jgi:cleavage and polyadenylation specificity factor subunit 2
MVQYGKFDPPSSSTIHVIYAVIVNDMLERHLDDTVLIRQAAGGIFEPLERPDLLITDADSTPSRGKDRDAALIGKLSLLLFQSTIRHYRYNHGDDYFSQSLLLLPCD